MNILKNSRALLEKLAPQWTLTLIKRVVCRVLIIRGMNVYKGNIDRSDGLETVLIVSHESSETGAPILALNISKGLNGKANVIILTLKSGDLMNEFIQYSTGVIMPKTGPVFSALLAKEIKKLAGDSKPTYAIVNSVVSCGCLQPIRKLGIPTLTLIHEFSCYIRPISLVNTIGLWSDKLIFSSELTKDDLFQNFPQMTQVETIILPQGKCEINENIDAQNFLHKELRNTDYLNTVKKDEILILGAGAIQPERELISSFG